MSQNQDQKPKTKDRLAAVILAAGQSKRMGAFKPLLPFGPKTVLESCVDYLLDGGVETVVVVVGQNGNAIRESLQHLPIRIVLNPNPESEMSDSIKLGVRELAADTQATFITPADHPAVSPAVVVELANEWRKSRKILVPEFQGRGGHPVLIDLSLRDNLLNLDSSRGLRGLFEARANLVKRVPVNCPFVARDLDTWDDYRALHFEVFGTAPDDLPRQK
jgi:molybdenum cofactor cytidylyltransferase